MVWKAGKAIRDWSKGIPVAVPCDVELSGSPECNSPGVSLEIVLVESLNKYFPAQKI